MLYTVYTDLTEKATTNYTFLQISNILRKIVLNSNFIDPNSKNAEMIKYYIFVLKFDRIAYLQPNI